MRKYPRYALIGLLTAATLAAILPLVWQPAQAQYERFARTGVRIPDPTEAGVWDGTWWYLSRDAEIAIWLRTENGKPELKLRYASRFAPEDFTTDWNGSAEYETKDGQGVFALHLDERDENSLKGTWDWKLDLPNSGRIETAKVELYRSGTGRQLVIRFDEMKLVLIRGDRESTIPIKQALTFRKASKRLLRWEELPF